VLGIAGADDGACHCGLVQDPPGRHRR
jgi:hypothetical protein